MASQEHAVRAGNAARQPVAAELAEARQAQQSGLDGSPRCVAQREQLSAAFGTATLQRQVGIEGVDDADVEAKIVAIVKYCSPKAPYKALVSKHGEPQVLAAIRAMVTDPVPHGNFKLQQFGQPIAFLGKLSDYMEPKAAAQEPLLRNDVVEMPDGTVGVVREVEGVKALVQSIRKLSSPPSSREYADGDPEWVPFDRLKKSKEVLNLQPEADTARPLKSFSLGARPKPDAKPLAGSATAPVKFDIGKDKLPEPAPSSSKVDDGSRVVPKDLSFKPRAFHMNWNTTEGRVGARYIRQMALAGRLEGFIVVATVPENRIQKFYAMVDDPAALENIQIRPVPEEHNPWAEDSGDFHTDGSVHMPRRGASGSAAPGQSIPAARERRGFYGRPTDKDKDDIGRIGASVSKHRLERNKIELAHASGIQAYENASHIEGGNFLSGTTFDGRGYALVGRDGAEATRAVLASRLGLLLDQVSDADVRKAISIDYRIDPKLIFFIEQPGEFHLDMSMVLMGPGQVIVNDCLEVFELQQEWMYADYLKLKPALDSGPQFEAWQKLGEALEGELARLAAHASRMFGYERRAVNDLRAAGLEVRRVAGAFPSGGNFLPGMNFLNGEGGVGAGDQPFFVTNGGDPRAEQYVAQQYLLALGTGLKRVYFIDPEASRKSIEETSGGLGCRTKGEGSV